MNTTVIVAFCRFPTPGQVKTRLAAGVGDQTATELYKTCAEQIFLEADRASNSLLHVACSSAAEVVLVEDWLSSLNLTVPCFPQATEEDLGGRMLHALRRASQGLGHKALLIGTDIPDICAAILEQAAALLDNYQVVLGPAADGGFYLIGVTAHHPRLFQDVPWSVSTTLQKTVQNATGLGLSISHRALPVLRDIDTVADLKSWHAEAARQGGTKSSFFAKAASALSALGA